MGVDSGIGWTDNTFNPWWGCQKVSPACDNCYAEAWAKRTGFPDAWSGKYRFFGDKHWNEPLRWQKKAEKEDRRIKVFCASMADWADNQVPGGDKLRARLFETIKATPLLDWQLLTKRIGNVERILPKDWKSGYANVWLGITVVNQAEADRDVPKLLRIPARVRWLSIEPMLGPMSCGKWFGGVDWIVVGGESGANARPLHPLWARGVRDQCIVAGVPYFYKQTGEWTLKSLAPKDLKVGEKDFGVLAFDGTWMPTATGWNGRDIDLDTGEAYMVRAGLKNTGNFLDGRTWTEFPC